MSRTVLVTAVGGGGVGEQLVKALRLADREYLVIGTDADPRSLGLQEVDVPVLLPLASADGYLQTVLDVCRRLGVRAVYPGSEPELLALSAGRTDLAAAGAVLLANTPSVIATGLDKGRTAAFLEERGFHPPRSVVLTAASQLGTVDFLPVVLKPNTGGGGSANVFVAQTREELTLFAGYLLRSWGSCLAQEYVGTASDEYTVGVLTDLEGGFINSIAVRRNILPAFSNRARTPNRTRNPEFGSQLVVSNGISQGEIGPFPEVTAVCEQIATALDSRGPLNIQCRVAGGVVRVFEINPRFSGTASLRALAGFNEPDLLFRRHVEGEALPRRSAYRSGHIVRGLREVMTDPALEHAAPGAGDFRWTLPPLPFVFRPLETPHNPAGIPDRLSLGLGLEPGTGVLRQLPDPAVAAALEAAYRAGSEIPGMMDETGIGKEYADDFLELLAEDRGNPRLDGQRLLEIGCGTGYLLSRCQALGARVLGVEPGPQGQMGQARFGVSVIEGWFPTPKIEGEFDLVILYLVLEHLPDPGELLRAVRARTAAGGRIALVVPDAEPFLEEADGSILFHEHYSYFTAATLCGAIRGTGGSGIRIRRSRLSRLLFATFGFDACHADTESAPSLADGLVLAHRFRTGVARTAARLAAWLASARAAGHSVAVYVPGRFVNYLALGGLPTDGLRFVDDSPALRGRYFPGIPIPVEGQDDLVNRPPDRVLIMSRSFGAKIRARLVTLLPETCRITVLDELLE